MTKIIDVQHLVKKYNNLTAVSDISFSVEKGQFFAFLGTNGAGKSTTIDILTTLIESTSGKVLIDGLELGKDDYQIRQRIGSVFQIGVLDENLTVIENLWVRGGLYNFTKKELDSRIKEVISITDCKDFLNQKYGSLSGGQKRRVDIARALINMPKILFLDEPTSGLDPNSRKQIWNTIRKMQSNIGTTIFLTTHYMEEANEADQIAVIDKGKLVAVGSPLELKEKYSYDTLKLYKPTSTLISYAIDTLNVIKTDNDYCEIKVTDIKQIIEFLYEQKSQFESFEFIKGNMDDVFLNIIANKVINGGNDNEKKLNNS